MNSEIKHTFLKQIDTFNILELDSYIAESFIDTSNDVELVILKGHMLVEYTINLAIEKLAFRKASAIIDLQFSTKLLFAEALGLFEGETGNMFCEQIRSLTKMRNDIAHRLNFNNEHFLTIIKHYPTLKAHLEQPTPGTSTGLCLNHIVTLICGYVLGRLKVKIAVNEICLNSVNERQVQEAYLEEYEKLHRHLEAINLVFDALINRKK
jgi:hypothetical protein